jgi:hypothetical protein
MAELLSPLPVVSTDPLPVLVPVVREDIVPLLSELFVEEPAVEEEVSLPPTPAFTLADATPGMPPLTDAPAFQLSLCPDASELLVPVPEECPVDWPLVLEVELPAEALSLCDALSVWEALLPLDEFTPCDRLAVSDQLSEWLRLSEWLCDTLCPWLSVWELPTVWVSEPPTVCAWLSVWLLLVV